jgi:hypothetical protein
MAVYAALCSAVAYAIDERTQSESPTGVRGSGIATTLLLLGWLILTTVFGGVFYGKYLSGTTESPSDLTDDTAESDGVAGRRRAFNERLAGDRASVAVALQDLERLDRYGGGTHNSSFGQTID